MEQPPPLPETPATAEPAHPPMSLPARLVNVFAVPGDVFEEVKAAHHSVANWLVPVLIACVVGVASVLVVFSQPAIQQKISEKQTAALEKKFGEMVEAGKITRDQADRQLAAMEKFVGPLVMKISGSVGVVFYSFARVFFWALILWLVGRWWLKAEFGYMKAAEVVGLAGMITVLGLVVKTLLQVNFSNPAASPSLALAVGEFDEKNIMHVILAMLDLFKFWELGVLGAGLARLTGTLWARATFPLLVVWLVITIVLGTFAAVAMRLNS